MPTLTAQQNVFHPLVWGIYNFARPVAGVRYERGFNVFLLHACTFWWGNDGQYRQRG